MSEKRILKLSLFNKPYVIATDEKDEDIYSAADHLNSLLADISGQLKSNNEGKIAVLAALQLAVDLAKQKKQDESYISQLSELVEKLEDNCGIN